MTDASEVSNVPSTRDWAVTGGVVGALIGAAWGIGLFRFDPENAGLLLLFMGFGLAAGITGGAMMNVLKPSYSRPFDRFLQVVTIGAVSGALFGSFLFLVGAIFTAPSGGVGGAFTLLLVRRRWFRWAGGSLAIAIVLVAIWQLRHSGYV